MRESGRIMIPSILLLILVILPAGTDMVSGDGNDDLHPDPIELIPHDPIVISGDHDVQFSAGSGSGTADDPFVIEHLSINATGSIGIMISNVTDHLVIDECLIWGGFFFKYIGFLIENCSNIEIRGCAVYYSHMGIEILDSDGITISDCFIGGSRNGINLTGTGCLIRNTTVKYNSMYGFTIKGGGGNRIENCLSDGNTGVLGDSGGIRIIDSDDNILAGCMCTVNYGDGIGIFSSTEGGSPPEGNIVIDCISNYNVNGIYLGESGGNDIINCTFRSNSIGVYAVGSWDSRVVDTLVKDNEFGVKIVHGSRLKIMNSSITENDDGVRILSSSENVFIGNSISNNDKMGIVLTVKDNYGGISVDNLFHGNVIDNNGLDSRQVIDNGNGTSWDDGASGNYWEDHQSPDDDGDGVVDIPREIFGDDPGRDRFPLIGDFPDEETDGEIVDDMEDDPKDEDGRSIWEYVLIVAVVLILAELIYLFIVKYRFLNKK